MRILQETHRKNLILLFNDPLGFQTRKDLIQQNRYSPNDQIDYHKYLLDLLLMCCFGNNNQSKILIRHWLSMKFLSDTIVDTVGSLDLKNLHLKFFSLLYLDNDASSSSAPNGPSSPPGPSLTNTKTAVTHRLLNLSRNPEIWNLLQYVAHFLDQYSHNNSGNDSGLKTVTPRMTQVLKDEPTEVVEEYVVCICFTFHLPHSIIHSLLDRYIASIIY